VVKKKDASAAVPPGTPFTSWTLLREEGGGPQTAQSVQKKPVFTGKRGEGRLEYFGKRKTEAPQVIDEPSATKMRGRGGTTAWRASGLQGKTLAHSE